MDKKTIEILSKCCRGGYMEGLWLCRRALEGDSTRILVTPNAEMLSSDGGALLSRADLFVPDGIGIRAAMRRLGRPAQEKTCGIELAQRLFENYTARGAQVRVFLLGGRPGVAARAAERLGERYGGVEICGVHHGYFDVKGEENRGAVKKINASGAELLIVCMGFPRQERWMLENRHRLPKIRLMMGLGGSLDVWSGDVPRAPEAVRSAGLEWAYRALKQPSRLGRLPNLVRFAADVAALPRERLH